MFFFIIIITVQICKFNITVSTQFLQLYYSLWCPGLQRLQRFDLFMCANYVVLDQTPRSAASDLGLHSSMFFF